MSYAAAAQLPIASLDCSDFREVHSNSCAPDGQVINPTQQRLFEELLSLSVILCGKVMR
jgi:hypothetical protein